MEFFYALKNRSELQLSGKPFVDVISIREKQQGYQNNKSCDLGVFQEFVTGFVTRDHFIERKDHMSSVKCRDGQQVHECQHDRQQGRNAPEGFPVPRGGKDASYGDESAQARGSFLGKHVFELTHVILQRPVGS